MHFATLSVQMALFIVDAVFLIWIFPMFLQFIAFEPCHVEFFT